MLTQETLDKMRTMKMGDMAEAFTQQMGASDYAELSFEERVGLMIDSEWIAREQRKLTRRLRTAKLRYPASLEDVDFKAPRPSYPKIGSSRNLHSENELRAGRLR